MLRSSVTTTSCPSILFFLSRKIRSTSTERSRPTTSHLVTLLTQVFVDIEPSRGSTPPSSSVPSRKYRLLSGSTSKGADNGFDLYPSPSPAPVYRAALGLLDTPPRT